jgi:hypothetical protein
VNDKPVDNDILIYENSYNFVERHIHRCPACGAFHNCDEATCQAQPRAGFTCSKCILPNPARARPEGGQ